MRIGATGSPAVHRDGPDLTPDGPDCQANWSTSRAQVCHPVDGRVSVRFASPFGGLRVITENRFHRALRTWKISERIASAVSEISHCESHKSMPAP